MSQRPIFVATHPRSCSTAFERIFMTRQDLTCIHEPFGDAFYYGPERLSQRYEHDERSRIDSGFSDSTFSTVLTQIEKAGEKGKRLFIKDIAYYLFPPSGLKSSIAPSLDHIKETTIGHGHAGAVKDDIRDHCSCRNPHNPTVLPERTLKKFHFTFLIRHPRYSVPSFYRCTIPPLDKITGFHDFLPSEAGYAELRRFFDYLTAANKDQYGDVNPRQFMSCDNCVDASSPLLDQADVSVIDADDLLEDPEGMIQAYCKIIGLDFKPEMLTWNTEADHAQAINAFEKWKGFHEDAIESDGMRQRPPKTIKSMDEESQDWVKRFGVAGAKTITDTVTANIGDYEYLKRYSMQPLRAQA